VRRALRDWCGAFVGLVLLTGSAQASQPDTIAPEPVSYTIDVTLDEHAHALRATERIEYRHVAGTELERLYLQLFPNAFRDARTAYARDHARLPWLLNPLDWIPWGSARGFITIRSVRVDGREAAFTVKETLMEVPLPSPLRVQDTLSVEIAFEVKLALLRYVLGYRGSNYAMANWFPKLAVPDTAGWRGEGEPSEATFDADRGSYDVRITTPSEVVVAATGDLVETSDNRDGTATRRWRATQVGDFAWVADRRYRVKPIEGNGVTVQYLYLGGDERLLERGAETIRAALDSYGTRWGPYPHRTLVIAETPALGPGVAGIAHSRLIMIPASFRASALERYLSQALPPDLYEGVLAHEIAHQWWGVTIGVRDDQDAWLNEGLAEFAAWDLERERAGRGARPQGRQPMSSLRRVEYVVPASLGFDERVLQPDTAFGDMMAGEVARYAKGPPVVGMLGYLVGRDTLDRILRTYAERFRYRTGRTPDFVAVAQSVAGRDLTWFFDQWLDSTATCDYSIAAVTSTPQPGAGYRSVITVRRNDRIIMPVEVEIILADGAVLRRVWDGRETSHDMVIDSAPRVRRAVLDPDGRLLETKRFNNYYPRTVRSGFRPWPTEDEAYRIVHVPFARYDEGVELGLLLAGGRAPWFIPPTWFGTEHLATVGAGYNLATGTAGVILSYSNRLGLLGRRAFWGASVRRDRKRETATLSAQALFGPHFWSSPFHTLSVSLMHQRRFETTPKFDLGTVRSVELAYGLGALVTDFYPIHGGMVEVAAEGAWKGLGSNWAFLRAAAQAQVYQRVVGGIKLALNGFAGTVAAGAAPRQKLLFLSREANFRAAQFDTVAGQHLTAFNGELRVPVGTGTYLGVAGFVNLAKYWGSGAESQRLRREVGIGLRLFDNAAYGVQLDVPFWTSAGPGTESFNLARLSLRAGRPYRRPGS